jgi:hypothetical protein
MQSLFDKYIPRLFNNDFLKRIINEGPIPLTRSN